MTFLSLSEFTAKKPLIGSLIPRVQGINSLAMYVAPLLMMNLLNDQPIMPPPLAYLLAMARSAPPLRTALTNSETTSGGCCRSASMTTTDSAPLSRHTLIPALMALPRPSLAPLSIRMALPVALAKSRTTSCVPSVLPSSTTTMNQS